MTEIRVYYECLEQAFHYIQPIIESAGCPVTVTLVKRAQVNYFSNGVLRSIHSLVTPDILITGVAENREVPLTLIEFTEAVLTEDHELQKCYGFVAAYLAEMFYVKISGQKTSEKEFGGAEYDPYTTPRIAKEQLGYEGFVIAEWATNPNNTNELQHPPELPACPPEIAILRETIQKSVEAFCADAQTWYANAVHVLQKTDAYSKFAKRMNAAPSFADLINTWKARATRRANLNQLRYFVRDGWAGAKINRFDHAMDPDRGILIFISVLLSDGRDIFGVYALVRPKTEGLKEELTSIASLRSKLDLAFQKDKGGIPTWLMTAIRNYVKRAKKLNTTMNLQPVWDANRDEIQKNRVVMTLAYFLDGLYLNQNGIKLKWNKYALLGGKKGKQRFGDLLRAQLGFHDPSPPTRLEEMTNGVDEDEVTYIIAHRVLIPNGFQIIHISYPGAQGGGAILPEKSKGLSQKREYLDVLAVPPRARAGFDALLNENKGMFQQSSIEKDIRKLTDYQANEEKRDALKQALVRAQVMSQDGIIRDIVIGIGFGTTNDLTTWRPDAVDFIFRIVGRTKWAIGIFRQDLRDMIPHIEGEINFPRCYRIAKSKQLKLL